MARSKQGFAISKKKLETKIKNDSAFGNFFNNLRNIALSSFLYENLPKTIDTDYMEQILFDSGMCAIFEEPNIGLVALPCVQSGGYDLFGYPLRVRAYSGFTGFSRMLKYKSYDIKNSDCVLVFNTAKNFSSAVFRGTIANYAERLTNDLRTEDVNIHAQRTPVGLSVPKEQVETFTNLLDRYEEFGLWVFGYNGLNIDALKAIRTEAPFVANEINEHRTKIWNEALGFLGVSNVSIYKKERVTNDEVARSMGGAIANRNVRQNPREKAIAQVTEKWGEKYGFSGKVTFNEALFDLEYKTEQNLIGYNRDDLKEEEQKGGKE